ncbi:MAG: hypothetical protein M3Z66_15845 [Chloroflexota bacterium]|nr:hypothetical protein [Chloroflexota bacterium]
MNEQLQHVSKAQLLWDEDRAYQSGELIVSLIPAGSRQVWAATLLHNVLRYVPYTAEFDKVVDISQHSRRWPEALSAFHRVRTLRQEETHDRVYDTVAALAENVAKVTYNASNPTVPFDRNAGPRAVADFKRILDAVADPALCSRARPLVAGQERIASW